jgi:hypothetical protein
MEKKRVEIFSIKSHGKRTLGKTGACFKLMFVYEGLEQIQ